MRLERSRERWFAKSDEERDDRDPMHPAPKSWTSHDEPDAGLNAEKLLLVRLVEDAVRASEGEDGTSFWVRHAAMTRVGDRWYGRALVSTHILSSTHGRYIWLFRYHSEHHSWDKAPGSLRATEHEQWPNKEHTIECVRSSPAAAAKAWGIPVDLPRRWAKDAEGAVEREDEAARSKTEAEDAQAERRDPPP
ncbi:MAG: hypothetical protein HYU66_27050 [Armatimonadetes bacterium]|nr:hypothetical protein [Armatimonadota bacterium]